MYQTEKFDMTAFGQAVKEAREKRGLSREDAAEIVDLSPRYFMYIETRGQHISLQKLYEIATLFNISVDQFFFASTGESKTTQRRQLDAMLDSMNEKDLSVITKIAEAIKEAYISEE